VDSVVVPGRRIRSKPVVTEATSICTHSHIDRPFLKEQRDEAGSERGRRIKYFSAAI